MEFYEAFIAHQNYWVTFFGRIGLCFKKSQIVGPTDDK